MHKPITWLGLAVGLCLGFTLSFAPSVDAARNSAGTYALPSGNPVVSGTTITSAWANNTLSDISTELTSSLDRSGRGAMLAPLQCVAGTVAAPGLTFSGDVDTGLYRASANNPAMAAGGVQAQEWSTAQSLIPIGLTVTQDTLNTAGTTTTGNGTGVGLSATGGATGNGISGTAVGGSGSGVVGSGFGTGAGVVGLGGGTSGTGVSGSGGSTIGYGVHGTGGSPNGSGVYGVGTGNGNGVLATGGGSSAAGTYSTGGTPNGTGVQGVGVGTGAGGLFTAGTAATGGTRQIAVDLTNGDLDMDGVAYPATATAVKNRLTPAGIPKVWGVIDNATTTVAAGLNVDTATTCSSSQRHITFAQDLSSASFMALCQSNSNTTCNTVNHATTGFSVTSFDSAGGQIDLCITSPRITFLVYGAQ